MYFEMLVAQFVITDISHPWQRGSFASSHAKMAVDFEYRVTSALM
jgi:hypothetical protein